MDDSPLAELKSLQNRVLTLERRLAEAEARAGAKYQTVAKAVFDTVKDRAATWDTACDELIWGDYDPNGPEEQPVSEAHLNECCARFPQWAAELRPFAERWNSPVNRLTDEEINAMEVTEEEVQRWDHGALRILRWADRVRAAERDRDAWKARAEEAEKAGEQMRE